jgi:hypothetical protein
MVTMAAMQITTYVPSLSIAPSEYHDTRIPQLLLQDSNKQQ